MDLKKVFILIFLLIFLNNSFAQADLPGTIVDDPGQFQQQAQQQASQTEILSQIVQLKEQIENMVTKAEAVEIAKQLNGFNEERTNNLIILTVIIHLSTIAGAYGIYFFLKSRKRI